MNTIKQIAKQSNNLLEFCTSVYNQARIDTELELYIISKDDIALHLAQLWHQRKQQI
jgi:isopentenyl phosphate kinase